MRVAKHIEEEFLDEYGVSLSERELEMAAELVSTSQKRSPSKSSGRAVSERVAGPLEHHLVDWKDH